MDLLFIVTDAAPRHLGAAIDVKVSDLTSYTNGTIASGETYYEGRYYDVKIYEGRHGTAAHLNGGRSRLHFKQIKIR